jgi:hypothetical protein
MTRVSGALVVDQGRQCTRDRGWSGGPVSASDNGSTGIVEQRLRLRGGFHDADRPVAVRALAGLERHLGPWEPDEVRLELSVKDRDRHEQRVTLEAWLPGLPPLVATSRHRGIDHALVEVRKDLVRQITDEKELHKPRRSRSAPKRST